MMENVSEVLPRVHEILARRYGNLAVISGRGIAKGQRIELEDRGKLYRCVIKVSSGGRISFGRRDDGTWSGLSDSDRVVVIAPTSLDGDDAVVSMFDQTTLIEAFESCYDAQQRSGMSHLPIWLAPFHEEGRGPRGVGDGFGDKSLWTEAADLRAEEAEVVTAEGPIGVAQALAALRTAVAAEFPGVRVEVRLVL
jgi:hypothetical protein